MGIVTNVSLDDLDCGCKWNLPFLDVNNCADGDVYCCCWWCNDDEEVTAAVSNPNDRWGWKSRDDPKSSCCCGLEVLLLVLSILIVDGDVSFSSESASFETCEE